MSSSTTRTGAEVLVLGWGSTWAAITAGVRRVRAAASRVAHAHLTHLNPFPADLGDVLARYERVLIPEMNLGQLAMLVRAEFLVDAAAVQPGHRPARSGPPRWKPASWRDRDDGSDDGHSTIGHEAAMTEQAVTLTRKDFESDQEVRWCPGCGDYGILAAIQFLLPELGIEPQEMVFVSGIGCAARLPYYMNTYGVHSIHGRAPAVATGVAVARPDLHVWVIGGDGDMLSIGGNHLIHALRRNVETEPRSARSPCIQAYPDALYAKADHVGRNLRQPGRHRDQQRRQLRAGPGPRRRSCRSPSITKPRHPMC